MFTFLYLVASCSVLVFFWLSREYFLLEQFQMDMAMVLMRNRYTLSRIKVAFFFQMSSSKLFILI